MVEPWVNTAQIRYQRPSDITTGANLFTLLRFGDHLKRVTEMLMSQLQFIRHQHPLRASQGTHKAATARQITVNVLS